jgi:hypothetical protein
MGVNDTTLKIVGGAFGAVGLVTGGIAGFLIVSHLQFVHAAVHVEGVVLEDHGRPRVQFQAGAKTVEIEGSVRSTPPAFKKGEKVTVLYPEGDPDAGEIDSFIQGYLAPLILGSFGVVFGGIGFGMLGAYLRARARRARALAKGRKVTAKVLSVHQDPTVRTNGRCPWVVQATYTDDDKRAFVFTSETTWLDPTAFYPVGGDVTVFYVEDEPKVNAVVLDKLPEEV